MHIVPISRMAGGSSMGLDAGKNERSLIPRVSSQVARKYEAGTFSQEPWGHPLPDHPSIRNGSPIAWCMSPMRWCGASAKARAASLRHSGRGNWRTRGFVPK